MIARRGCLALGMALGALAALWCPPGALCARVALPMQRALGGLAARTPIPVAEIMVILAAGLGAVCLARALLRAPGTRGRSLALFLTGALDWAAFALLAYALLWAPIARTPALRAPESAEPAALSALARDLGSQARALWTGEFPDARAACEEAAAVLHRETGRRPVIKAARYPELMKRLGLAGVCFPLSGEALVRSDLSGLSLPFVAAHEGAHQLGWGDEGEASYLAYRACLKGSAAARYSGTAYMLYYALEALKDLDAKAYLSARGALDARVLLDVGRIAAAQAGGRLLGAAEVFLRATGQTGRAGYARAVLYLLADQQSS